MSKGKVRRRIDLGFGHTYVLDGGKVPKYSANTIELKRGGRIASDEFGKIRYWDYTGRGEFAYRGQRIK